MTGSWTMDGFIIGCVLLLIIPLVIYIYVEKSKKEGDTK